MLLEKIVKYFNSSLDVDISDKIYFYTDEHITSDGKYQSPTVGKEITDYQGEVKVKSWENFEKKLGFSKTDAPKYWKSPQDCRLYLNRLYEKINKEFKEELSTSPSALVDFQNYYNTFMELESLFDNYEIHNKQVFLFKKFSITYSTISKETDKEEVIEYKIDFNAIRNKNTLITLENYSFELKNFLELIIQRLESFLNIPLDAVNIHKLLINLSVSDIALMYRLFDEEKLINYKHRTEIYKYISTTLQTPVQQNISESSVKNKFLTPDIAAIEKLKTLFTNLKIQLQKIENKISE